MLYGRKSLMVRELRTGVVGRQGYAKVEGAGGCELGPRPTARVGPFPEPSGELSPLFLGPRPLPMQGPGAPSAVASDPENHLIPKGPGSWHLDRALRTSQRSNRHPETVAYLVGTESHHLLRERGATP